MLRPLAAKDSREDAVGRLVDELGSLGGPLLGSALQCLEVASAGLAQQGALRRHELERKRTVEIE